MSIILTNIYYSLANPALNRDKSLSSKYLDLWKSNSFYFFINSSIIPAIIHLNQVNIETNRYLIINSFKLWKHKNKFLHKSMHTQQPFIYCNGILNFYSLTISTSIAEKANILSLDLTVWYKKTVCHLIEIQLTQCSWSWANIVNILQLKLFLL